MKNALLVIDDGPIRKASARSAEKLMRQLDRLEASLETYSQVDQKLFTQWMDRTFADERARIDRLQDEFKRLARFHNWVIALSELENLPLHEAYRELKREERKYERGSEAVRARIDEERARRDRFIEDEVRSQAERRARPEPKKQSVYAQEIFTKLWRMSDDELRELCADEDEAFELLSLCLRLSLSPEDDELFMRVWGCVPERHRKAINVAFQDEYGTTIDDVLAARAEDLRAREEEAAREADERATLAGELSGVSAASNEVVKNLYRRLARLLHPDLNGGERPELWQQRFWERTVAAYQRSDANELESLYRLTSLRLSRLNDLSISEINASREWLANELGLRKEETKGLRRKPAWNFSAGRKDLSKLAQRLRGDFQKQASQVETQIWQLRAEHARYDRLSRLESL